MVAAIFKETVEVANALAECGTSGELLLTVLDAMVTAKNDCTDNDPPGSRGWRAWQMGTRRNREVHVGLGDWEKDDTDQVPSITSKKLGIRIVICNTDDGTCRDDGSPQNSSKKGAGNEQAIDANNQMSLDLRGGADAKVVPLGRTKSSDGPVITYYLCAYIVGDDIRAELSLPTSFESGFFGGFAKRIYIVGGDTPPSDGAKVKPADDGDSGFDIPVKLKKPI